MNPVRRALRYGILLALLAVVPVLVVGGVLMQLEYTQARAQYLETKTTLEETTGRLAAAERRLRELTTSVDAVEREVRRQLHLIKPGERLLVIQRPGSRPD